MVFFVCRGDFISKNVDIITLLYKKKCFSLNAIRLKISFTSMKSSFRKYEIQQLLKKIPSFSAPFLCALNILLSYKARRSIWQLFQRGMINWKFNRQLFESYFETFSSTKVIKTVDLFQKSLIARKKYNNHFACTFFSKFSPYFKRNTSFPPKMNINHSCMYKLIQQN